MNLAAPEGTSGDWHDVFHWQDGAEQPRQVTLAGMGDIETSPIYGGLGIYEGKDRLVAQGLDIPASMQRVYIANHSRAILDLLYRSLNRWGRVLNLTGATTDWLDTREQGERLLEQATLLEGGVWVMSHQYHHTSTHQKPTCQGRSSATHSRQSRHATSP